MSRRWMAGGGVLLCAAFAAATLVRAQGAAAAAPAAGALSAMDYVEIQQLVARYGFALDTGADNGYMFADLFTPDGTFNNAKGRDALAALARGARGGPLNVRNMSNFAIIKPSPEGATGIQYAQAINFAERDRKLPTELDHFGRYDDVYARTPEGWRFKSRRFTNESGSLRPAAQRTAPASAGAQSR